MTLVVRPLLIFLLMFGVVCAASAQAINTSSIYRNETLGVRGVFSPDWNIITSRSQAPDALKPNFPVDKGPNDSPLFIGLHSSEQVFIRLLSETWFDDLEAFADVLEQSISGQGMEIISANVATDNSALEFRYRHPQLGLVFKERVVLMPESQIIRLAAWTSASLMDSFAPVIEAAFADLEFFDAINADPGWQALWENLSLRMSGEEIAGAPGSSPVITEAVAGVSCPDPTSSMLWAVAGGGLAESGSEVYLFGSIHVGKPEFYPLDREVEDVFRASDYLVFEVDPTTVSSPEVMMNMQQQGMLPQGQTLEDVVSADVIADFRRLMANMGLPADNFMTMQPWLLTLMLTGLQMNSLGYLPQYGLESYFMAEKAASTDILELESIEQQIRLLQSLNAESFLAYTIEEFDTGKQEIEALIDAWECADKPALSRMLFEDFEDATMSASERAEMDALWEALYVGRNIAMAEKISSFSKLPKGQYFIVVGSAHLVGENSVIEHLREAGFQVSPVTVSP